MKTTGLSRVSKDIIIREIEKYLKGKSLFFITKHDTVSAFAMDKLRAKLRKSNSKYLTVKKSLGKVALNRASLTALSDAMDGSCGIVFGGTDPVAPSKILVDFAKENTAFKIQKAYMSGQIISSEDVKALASLPSREVLLARVLGGMQAPITGFVRTLSGTISKLVNVVDAIAKKKTSNE